jgi:hypothetical protein
MTPTAKFVGREYYTSITIDHWAEDRASLDVGGTDLSPPNPP